MVERGCAHDRRLLNSCSEPIAETARRGSARDRSPRCHLYAAQRRRRLAQSGVASTRERFHCERLARCLPRHERIGPDGRAPLPRFVGVRLRSAQPWIGAQRQERNGGSACVPSGTSRFSRLLDRLPDEAAHRRHAQGHATGRRNAVRSRRFHPASPTPSGFS